MQMIIIFNIHLINDLFSHLSKTEPILILIFKQINICGNTVNLQDNVQYGFQVSVATLVQIHIVATQISKL